MQGTECPRSGLHELRCTRSDWTELVVGEMVGTGLPCGGGHRWFGLFSQGCDVAGDPELVTLDATSLLGSLEICRR